MSLDWRLTLGGNTPVEQVAERALPDLDDRPTGTPPLLSSDLAAKLGFDLTVRAGRNGYVDASSDQGLLEWEPETYVSVAFHWDKSADLEWLVPNMLTIVRRVLRSGDEDAAFVFNGDVLLLTRFDGVLTKHRRETWWNHYPRANETLPG
ncbi:SitI3 family protein [Actinoplanes sp. NPDC024001]|uniref:SitI3 family protein n=1 Tax=Actinoplanes sp. NPDC024001 TaxID=3154598 RepID=UPI0033DD3725